MISQLVKPLSDIISNLSFVEKYGGIVQMVSRSTDAGEDALGETIFKQERYPVGCGITSDECWDNERYLDLIPDDKYKSVFYFEEMDGLRFEGLERMGGGKEYFRLSCRLRLVGWLNLPRLGIGDCNGAYGIAFTLFKRLRLHREGLLDPFDILQYDAQIITQEPKDYNPFTKYTYQDVDSFWMYPYDYISMVVEIRVVVPKNCLPDFEPGDDISCYPEGAICNPSLAINYGYQLYEQLWRPRLKAISGKYIYWQTFDLGPGTGDYVVIDLLQSYVEDLIKQEYRAKNSSIYPQWDLIDRLIEPDEVSGKFKVLTNVFQERNEITLWFTKA